MSATASSATKTSARHTESPRLYLIDGYGFVFRAYHVLPPLTNPQGTPVGAVYGFTNMLLKLLDKLRQKDGQGINDHIAVVFDSGQKTFRNALYAAYKANRPPSPEDLIPQFPLVRDAAEALHLPAVERDGYEADDVIAAYAKQAKAAGMKVTIVSSDKDLMQLVDDDVEMYDPVKDRRIGPREVEEKFGVPPEQVLDALALTGDSSDNVPGVPGIGPKTAAELLRQYGSLENILACASEIPQTKRRETLLANAAQARLSRQLVSLHTDIPGIPPISDLSARAPDSARLMAFLQAQGFRSLAARIGKNTGQIQHPDSGAAHSPEKPAQAVAPVRKESVLTQIGSPRALEAWLAAVTEQGALALHAAVGENGDCQALALAAPDGCACHVPLKLQRHDGAFDLEGDNGTVLDIDDARKTLRAALEDESVLKIGHDLKRLLKLFPGIEVRPLEDVMVMSYVLDGAAHAHDLATLAPESEAGENLPAPQALCREVTRLLPLRQALRARLFSEHMLTLYETIERPLISVLDAMEKTGVRVEASVLLRLSNEFAERLVALEKEVHALAGHAFNIGSPKQLGEVLFAEMNLPGGKKSKTGAYGTDAGVLEELAAQGHTIAEKALAWRELSKLRGTYTDALVKQIRPDTGRIHTTFDMAATSTGRLSSRDPNLQNIPIRSEDGRKIRAAFVAPEGYALIGADYSQIELRLLAHMAEIDTLKAAFRDSQDIHALTASQVFGVPLAEVDAATRRRAKAINFGIIYGLSAFGLANQLGISRQDAAAYIEAYFIRYPGIRDYMERTKELARKQGYVNTLFGRKCFLPGIRDGNPARRAFAERAAINAPLQGTAADIIKKAMVALFAALRAQYPRARMLLQIHDELILEAPEAQAEKVATLARREMERVAALSVPLTVEARIGSHWGEIH